MRVIATAKGYLGSLREAGDSFEVPDGTTGSWFASAPDLPDEDRPLAEPKPRKGRGKASEAASAGDEFADAI